MSNSNVDHPKHYQSSKIEVIDIIDEFNLNFNLGNCTKYILRAGKKDPSKLVEDLEKALWYLSREVKKIKGGVVLNGQEQGKERIRISKGSESSTKKTGKKSTKTTKSLSKRNKKPKSK